MQFILAVHVRRLVSSYMPADSIDWVYLQLRVSRNLTPDLIAVEVRIHLTRHVMFEILTLQWRSYHGPMDRCSSLCLLDSWAAIMLQSLKWPVHAIATFIYINLFTLNLYLHLESC